MWSVALESMTHVKEDERKYVFVLPNSMGIAMEVDIDLSEF